MAQKTLEDMQDILFKIFGPYNCIEEIAAREYLTLAVEGFGDAHPVFRDCIDLVKPSSIIEVGSWLGVSCLSMTRHLDTIGNKAKIMCIDTWLGSPEHVDSDSFFHLQRNGFLELLYYQFLYNIFASGKSDRIIPFRQTSVNAAKFLIQQNVKADFIYLDGSHEYEEVVHDIDLYYEILSDKGLILGDDYDSFIGVKDAVDEFVAKNDKTMHKITKNFWMIAKDDSLLNGFDRFYPW